MQKNIKIIANNQANTGAIASFDSQNAAEANATATLQLDNTVDPRTLDLDGVTRIDLHFPKFTDGRAYSQAFLLRRRLGFAGELRATGDVLIDQLVQMQRSGFDVAQLRGDQDIAHAQRQFDRFGAYYQGDAVTAAPHFARAKSRLAAESVLA